MLNEPLRLLIYGPPGRGKTHFLGSITSVPELMPAILIEVDAGLRTIASKCRRIEIRDIGVGVEPGTIDVVSPKNWNEVASVYRAIYKSFEKSPAPYKSVMLDSLSELNFMNLTESIEIGKEKDGRGKHDPVLPDQQDYNRSGIQMRTMIQGFRRLPCPIFFTATTREKIDGDGVERTLPNLSGQLAGDIPAMFDILGYLALQERGNVFKRSLIMGPRKGIDTKYRGEKGVIQSIDDPTIPLLIQKINEIESAPV